MEAITYKADTKTIQEIVHYYDDGMLNLEPGFQRESVRLRAAGNDETGDAKMNSLDK